MKMALVVFGLLAVATVANAQESKTENPYLLPVELCQMEDYDASIAAFEELETLDIKQVSSLTGFQLDLVNQHLVQQEYTPKALTFAEIKALFSSDGDEGYNDLYLITYKSKKSGKIYIQAKTWPGDNPYGLIFTDAGKLVGHNGDGSISLFTISGGQVSCFELGLP